MADSVGGPSFSQPNIPSSLAGTRADNLENAQELKQILQAARKDAAQDSAQTLMQSRNPLSGQLKSGKKTLKERQPKVQASNKSEKSDESTKNQEPDKLAAKYAKSNSELKKESLLLLRQSLSGQGKEEIKDLLKKFYPEASLADEALDFLLESTEGELQDALREVKDELNEESGPEIKAGRNMGEVSREFQSKLGKPTELRSFYREVTTGDPKSPTDFFHELSDKYEFEQLKDAIQFLFSALGQDFRAKGPSIPKGELHRLMTECKTLQAILGVYYFFKSRMRLIESALKRNGIVLKKSISFKDLAKIFMLLVNNRYPSSDRVLAFSKQMGIDQSLVAQIIYFTQMRDAIRQTSPRIYRSDNHKEELWLSILDALEDLEIELEEEEEEELFYFDNEEEENIEDLQKQNQRKNKDTISGLGWTEEDKEDLDV